MKQIIVISSKIGLTGCQIIQLHEAIIMLANTGMDLIDAVGNLQRIAKSSIIEKNDFQSLIRKVGEAKSPFNHPIKEKKPKYIRQQHKLAQRHYRRK